MARAMLKRYPCSQEEYSCMKLKVQRNAKSVKEMCYTYPNTALHKGPAISGCFWSSRRCMSSQVRLSLLHYNICLFQPRPEQFPLPQSPEHHEKYE